MGKVATRINETKVVDTHFDTIELFINSKYQNDTCINLFVATCKPSGIVYKSEKIDFNFRFVKNPNLFKLELALQFYKNHFKMILSDIANTEKVLASLEKKQADSQDEEEIEILKNKISEKKAILSNQEQWRLEVCDLITDLAILSDYNLDFSACSQPATGDSSFNRHHYVTIIKNFCNDFNPQLITKIKIASVMAKPEFFPEVKNSDKAMIALREFYEALYSNQNKATCNACYKKAREELQAVCEVLHVEATSYSQEWNLYASPRFTKVTAFNLISSLYRGLENDKKVGRERRVFDYEYTKRQILLEAIQPLYGEPLEVTF